MDNLYRLSFRSRSTLPCDDPQLDVHVGSIVSVARRHNRAANLTSALAVHEGCYVQVIEGAQPAVEATFDRIRHDMRHRDVRVLHRAPVESRCLPGMPMALINPGPCGAGLMANMMTRLDDPASAGADVVATLMRDLLADTQSMARADGDADGSTHMITELAVLDGLFATALLSPHGRILRASANYLRLFGYTRDEIIGRRRRDLAVDEGANRLDQEELWATLRRGESRTLQYLAVRADGAELWVEGTFVPRLDDAGELREVVEVAVDVSQQRHSNSEHRGQIDAINISQAVTHLSTGGIVLDANPLFLAAMGYDLDEVLGRHHSMFVDPVHAGSAEYAAFWDKLTAGSHQAGEYRRVGKGGREVWLQATYSPIHDARGRLLKIVKYATDVSAQKLRQAEFQWQISAIHKSHAVITFSMDGLILEANQVFLDAMGYTLDQARGRHHRMFVEPSYSHSAEYAAFWRELGRGRHQAGQYRRVHRDGSGVWLQATYNPVFDMEGRPVKVVKYATVVTDEKLRQAEHQGQIAAIHQAQCVISFDLGGTILDANDNLLSATGYCLSEVRGRHHTMFVDPEMAASAEYALFWTRLAAGHHCSGEFKRITRDGREIWLQATYNPILDLSGRPFSIIKYATDVTAEKLRQAEYQGQIEAIHKSQAVVAFNLDGVIMEVNDIFLKTVDYSREQLLGRHHSILVEADHAASPEYQDFWDTLRAGRHVSGLYKCIGRNGDQIWIQASYNPILDLNSRPFKVVKFATDVTGNVALSEAYEDAKRQAQHDAATSLPNRVRLNAFMTSVLGIPGKRLVAFYLDLDHFKPINGIHGHATGDRVLGEVADRLRRLLSHDQLAARVGGDEFVVVAPDLPDDEIESFAQRMIDAVGVSIRHEAGELSVGASVGIAVGPEDGTTPDELLRCADTALYQSKRAGRGTFSFFTSTLNDRLTIYRNTVDDIRRGLTEQEFFLEYQPRFRTRDQHMRSAEALVRWNHPERGRINPLDFIPIAERSGLVVELGEWVLATACREAAAWPSIDVSVNVSPIQFYQTDVVAVVARVLQETGMEPRRLELEITEGVLLQDAERARSALSGLKKLGVRLAMDDFGTGYSSLSSLRSFPFDVIKIDRQFITDMDGREGGREVVRAILSLGGALGLSVTAEGVETSRQLAMLEADNCDEVQGYLLARPMSADGITCMLAGTGAAALPESPSMSGGATNSGVAAA